MARPNRNVPVLWLDVKGATARSVGRTPVEASAMITKGFGEVLQSTNHVFQYPKKGLEKIAGDLHVSLIKNGTLADMQAKAVTKPKEGLRKQMVSEILRPAMEKLAKWEYWVYAPIWNVDYEMKFIIDCASTKGNEDLLEWIEKKWRAVEMRGIGQMAHSVLVLTEPQRSDWRSLESLRWYHERTREIFGIND